jgi:hypothetical protein
MSFDIFLQCFRNGDLATFPRTLVEEIFARDAIAPDFPLTDVHYPDGSGGVIYGADDDEIDCLMFNHCGGEMFFAAMYELAHRTSSVIYWPDTRPSIAITEAETAAHFPKGFGDMGPPEIVKSGQELIDYIGRPDPTL